MASNKFGVSLYWIFIIVTLITDLSLCISQDKILRTGMRRDACRCGETNDELQSRIVGGVKMKPYKYPWLAVILKYNRFHCGGSVINDLYILTAGHCVFDEESREMISKDLFGIVLGVYDRLLKNETSRQEYAIDEIKVPALFHGDPMHDVHDVGLLKLDKRIKYTLAIKPVCLPSSNCVYDRLLTEETSRQYYKIIEMTIPALFHGDPTHDVHDVGLLKLDRRIKYSLDIRPVCLPSSNSFSYVEKYGIISGWGTLSFKGPLSQYPLEAPVRVISNEVCMKTRIVGSHFSENPKAMYCGYNVNIDACQGDSGGPMIIQEDSKIIQIGIISWGIECALKNHPGVYTRLTYYLDWIYNNTQDASYCRH